MTENLLIKNSKRKDLIGVLVIWLVLLMIALGAWWVVKSNALDLIYHIEYVEGNRFTRAEALYAEAEKHAFNALQRLDAHVLKTSKTLAVPPLHPDDENVTKGLALFERAFRLDPRTTFHMDKAKYYDRAATLAGLGGHSDTQIKYHTAGLASLGKPSEALKYLHSVVDDNSASPERRLLESEVLLNANRIDEAAKTLALVNDPANPEYLRQMAEYAHRSGNFKGAVESYVAYLELVPTDIDSRKALATVLHRQQQPSEAVAVMIPGIEHGGGDDAGYLHILGDAAFAAKDYELAITYLEQGADVDPVSGDLQFSLARAYHANGDKGKAARALQRAVQLNPELQSRVLE